MLLRTVHSILKRTPPELLSEIIMVNDNSPNDDLQEPLEKYVRYLPSKVMGIRAAMMQLFVLLVISTNFTSHNKRLHRIDQSKRFPLVAIE